MGNGPEKNRSGRVRSFEAAVAASFALLVADPGRAQTEASAPASSDHLVDATVVLLRTGETAAEAPDGAAVSPEKFAAILRRTLSAFGIQLREAPEVGGGRFVEALRAAEAAGRREKALGVVWLSCDTVGQTTVVAHLLDRVTGTTLSRELPEPPGSDDQWYRTASLALLGMLRSTLGDVPEAVRGDDGLEDLIRSVPPPEAVRTRGEAAGRSRMFPDLPALAVEASYAGLAQPTAGMYMNGARFAAAVRLLPFLALAADVQILADWTATGEDYLLSYTQVPVALTVHTALWPWFRVGAGVSLEFARAAAAYPDRDAVRSDSMLLVAPLFDLCGLLELSPGAYLLLGLRAGFPLNRTRYMIWGRTVAEQSPVELGVTAGLGMDLWR